MQERIGKEYQKKLFLQNEKGDTEMVCIENKPCNATTKDCIIVLCANRRNSTTLSSNKTSITLSL